LPLEDEESDYQHKLTEVKDHAAVERALKVTASKRYRTINRQFWEN
jgi:hypothetical protein